MKIIYRRLEFAFVLTLFFPVVTSALLRNNVDGSGTAVLRLGIAISCIILSFLILEHYKNGLHRVTEQVIKWLLCIEIFSFVPVLLHLSIYQGDVIKGPIILVYQTALIGIYLLPIAVLGILLIQSVYSITKFIR